MASFFPTAKDVLTKPEDFFTDEIKRIKRWQQPVMYLFFLTMIGAFFILKQPKQFLWEMTEQVVLQYGLEEFVIGFTPSVFGIAILFILLVFILLLATSFKYWVAHWYIKLWNKQARFQETYAVLTYGGTPGWLAMPFSALALFFLYQSVTAGGPGNWLLTIFSTIVWMGLEGYSIYLRVYAMARIQKITRWQVILSVYVLGLFTYLIGLIIIEFVIVSLVLVFLVAIGAI